MDPYVRFQIGHISHETPTATGGGKNPQWKISYRMYESLLIRLNPFDLI
jgi:hypothetical protein